jgi:hypothetical protein
MILCTSIICMILIYDTPHYETRASLLITFWGSTTTSRKHSFGPGQIRALVPVLLRTGINGCISPGSCGQDAGRASAGPLWSRFQTRTGTKGPRSWRCAFSPGWWLEPGLKVGL